MASAALAAWKTKGLARLAELEAVHVQATGSTQGRRWGTAQLNRSLFVMLVAEFQGYCRSLHDEATDVHIASAVAGQQAMLGTLLTQGASSTRRTRGGRLSVATSDGSASGSSMM